jgi:hypothetical protein
VFKRIIAEMKRFVCAPRDCSSVQSSEEQASDDIGPSGSYSSFKSSKEQGSAGQQSSRFLLLGLIHKGAKGRMDNGPSFHIYLIFKEESGMTEL